MKLELPLKPKSLHLHAEFETRMGDAAIDLKVDDPDNDGDPNYRIKWVGPGVIPDSGPEGISGEIPLMQFFKPVVDMVLTAASGVAGPLGSLIGLLRVSDDESDD